VTTLTGTLLRSTRQSRQDGPDKLRDDAELRGLKACERISRRLRVVDGTGTVDLSCGDDADGYCC